MVALISLLIGKISKEDTPKSFWVKLVFILFGKTKSHDFHYEVCEFAKHHRVFFPIRNKKLKEWKISCQEFFLGMVRMVGMPFHNRLCYSHI